MTNEQIIAEEAINNNIFSELEVLTMQEAGIEIPLHTMQGWAIRGKKKGETWLVKKGEHGIETKLWKKRDRKQKEKDEDNDKNENGEVIINGNFYLAKAFLFKEEQIEKLKEQ